MKLQPLKEADKVLKTEYIKTLKCYLNCNNDLLHTSEHMYIHRNTMNNRMRKISSLLNCNINAADVSNEFYNIFKVIDYYGEL
jgi:DNA-binding PucR family transcriptional regulator